MSKSKFLWILIFAFGVLFFALFKLTILEGERYRHLSEGQRIREWKVAAPRGLVKDRNGKVLARNRPFYRILNKKGEVEKILSHDEALEIEARGGSEAASLEVTIVREYVGENLLAHIIGYTGEVTKEEVQSSKLKVKSYEERQIVGRMGVEEEYDLLLRGVNGKKLIETNAQGEPLRVLGKIDPKPGEDLSLSIDFSLQKKAAELLGEKKGAVIVSNPQNGQVLALFSSPSFNPNIFVEGKDVENILKDPANPLFNRVIGGLYPPGSVFKIITATAGLEEGVIDSQTEIEDVGVIQIGPYRFANWFFTQYGKTEGMLDVVRAIKRSNDIFFYKVGQELGVEKLAAWGKKFGIGKTLGIDLSEEAEGLMPDPQWKEKVKGDKWFLGDTYHLAIGQGNLLVTPLQVNFWTAAIADGGRLCRPIVRLKTSGSRLKEDCQDLGLHQETVALIKEGMRQACEPGGTGWPLFKFKVRFSSESEKTSDAVASNLKLKIDGKNFLDGGGGMVEIPIGCKTGTAEFGDPKGRTHAWFTAFAPFEDPEIVVTVLVEEGGEGSYVAAPIAKEILREWFER